ncbi:hypothetical protein F2Q70_00038122 [Brassica cretica]|uniref:Uncharacterized protein n=1 Tax=Brassica cretica TaxID=69181 RepID=A0A8S9K9S0_BRACR|nr:hypothetical protein F2Q70_00038122 [Brassica cretica]
MSPFLELDMGHRRFNRNGTALVQIMGIDREQALAGLLAHSAGSAGSQLNSAGWSVGSSDQCVSSGRLPGRLDGQGWLWAGGFFWSGNGHGQSVWACFGHVQENDTEGMQWLKSNHPFSYIRKASTFLCRHARASAYTLKHKEKQRKGRELDGFNIQDEEWFEGHKENPPGPENTRKWSGKKRDGRIPLPMAKTSLRGEASSMSWEHTQMVRREGRRPYSTLNGMTSLEGRCSVESGFIGIQWKGLLVRPMERSYQYWKPSKAHPLKTIYCDVNGGTEPGPWPLNSAGWSVGSSDQCVSSGRLPGRLDGQGWLWAGGFFWSGHGHGHARASAYNLKHKEKQRKGGELDGFNIQDEEWFEGHKEGLRTHAKGQGRRGMAGFHFQWPRQPEGERREGRRPYSTLNGMNSLEGGCSVESGFMGVQWKGLLVRPMERSYQYWKPSKTRPLKTIYCDVNGGTEPGPWPVQEVIVLGHRLD